MKSSKKQLKERGYISDEELDSYINIPDNEIFHLLNSPIAIERTAGAKLLKIYRDEKFLPLLCELLKKENRLYTKIAVSEAIEQYGISAISYLTPLLGAIGKNQHKKPGLIDLKKKSFPLPRDIAGRIIIRIGEPALPYLEEVLMNGTYKQRVEAIDAIGHIVYYCKNYNCEKTLLDLLNHNSDDELICWKIIRAFQSFESIEVVNQLKTIIEKNDNHILKSEAERSLNRIEINKTGLNNISNN